MYFSHTHYISTRDSHGALVNTWLLSALISWDALILGLSMVTQREAQMMFEGRLPSLYE